MVLVGENRGHVGHVEIGFKWKWSIWSSQCSRWAKKNTLGGGAITQGGAEGMAGTTGILRGDAICDFFLQHFLFSPLFGEGSHFLRANFSDGLVEKTTNRRRIFVGNYLLKLTTCRYHLYPHIPLPTWKFLHQTMDETRPKRRSSARRSTNCRMVWGAGWSNFQSHSKR